MRAILSGSTYRVELDESDVQVFAERWPCYGERHAIAFEFERSTGDLVDIEGEEGGTAGDGLAALSNDCALAGAELVNLAEVAELRRPFSDPVSVAALKAACVASRAEERRAAIAAGPMAALRYHCSGAVERGEAEPIVAQTESGRIVTNGRESARINLASAGRYAVAIEGRIIEGPTVESLKAKLAPLGWIEGVEC